MICSKTTVVIDVIFVILNVQGKLLYKSTITKNIMQFQGLAWNIWCSVTVKEGMDLQAEKMKQD